MPQSWLLLKLAKFERLVTAILKRITQFTENEKSGGSNPLSSKEKRQPRKYKVLTSIADQFNGQNDSFTHYIRGFDYLIGNHVAQFKIQQNKGTSALGMMQNMSQKLESFACSSSLMRQVTRYGLLIEIASYLQEPE